MASLSLRHIYKIYDGNVKAVSDFNLEIDDKEFVVFVGPSGCGKSTTLRMVAGLEEITAGELYIDGKLVNDVEPKNRDIAMVFQNYALYPHMTVYENMAFGLKLRKMPTKEIDQRVKEAANILGITPLLARKPKALSGGQRQRVALGRAIVREPKVFLLDEPLSNLDAKLRVQMRTEITKLHNRLATTFIYVTHDQTEAMTMGTRIVVMKDGVVQQVDTPQFLYDTPENKFVASFLGSPQMNFFEKTILTREGKKMYATFGSNRIEIPENRARRLIDDSYLGREITLGIRPEDIHDEQVFISTSPQTKINARIDVMEKLGNETLLYMEVDGKEDYTIARVDARTSIQQGETVELAIDANHLHFFDNRTELTIMGVPKYNMFNVNLTEKDGGIVVKLGGQDVVLPAGIKERLVDQAYLGKDVKLGISPDALVSDEGTTYALDIKDYSSQDGEGASLNNNTLSEDDKKEMIAIKSTVEFSEAYPRYNAVYCTVKGKSTPMVSKHMLDAQLKTGTAITYYVALDDIVLFDADTNEIIVGSRAITNNIATATVTTKPSATDGGDGTVTFAIDKNKLTTENYGGVFTAGEYAVSIAPAGCEISKEALSVNSKLVLSGVVEDIDELGSTHILYIRAGGFEPYFTAIVNGTPKHNIGDKVKVAVRSDAFRRA